MAGKREVAEGRELKKTVVAAFPSEGKRALGRIEEIRGVKIRRMSIVAMVVLTSRMSGIIGKAGNSKGSRSKSRRKRMGGRLRTVISPNKGHGGGEGGPEESSDRHPRLVTARSRWKEGLVKGKNKGTNHKKRNRRFLDGPRRRKRSFTKKRPLESICFVIETL